MIKYEILKQNENLMIFEKIDDFYKFLIDDLFNECKNINDMNEIFQFSCDIDEYYNSYEKMRNIFKKNNINDYVICFDKMYEKIYVYVKNYNDIYYFNYCELFDNDYYLHLIETNKKFNILQTILNCMLYN